MTEFEFKRLTSRELEDIYASGAWRDVISKPLTDVLLSRIAQLEPLHAAYLLSFASGHGFVELGDYAVVAIRQHQDFGFQATVYDFMSHLPDLSRDQALGAIQASVQFRSEIPDGWLGESKILLARTIGNGAQVTHLLDLLGTDSPSPGEFDSELNSLLEREGLDIHFNE